MPIEEIAPSSYESMVLNQDRGHMTIIMLCDKEHKDFLVLYDDYAKVMKAFMK